MLGNTAVSEKKKSLLVPVGLTFQLKEGDNEHKQIKQGTFSALEAGAWRIRWARRVERHLQFKVCWWGSLDRKYLIFDLRPIGGEEAQAEGGR